jgi:hypothetical protein
MPEASQRMVHQEDGSCVSHELRNEVVEELIPHLVGENRAELDAPLPKDGRTRGMKGEKSRR